MNATKVKLQGLKRTTGNGKIEQILSELLNETDYSNQHLARLNLVSMGGKILHPMHKFLSSENSVIRREAAKIIELIADKRSIPALILLLDDPVFDIRWIAAEGLIKIGRNSIIPLLKSIAGGNSSVLKDKRAHHVLNSLLYENEKVMFKPLMQSLDNYLITAETAPVEAFRTLKQIKNQI